MEFRYLIYRTDFNNTIVRESNIDNPDVNEGSLYTDFVIPKLQPLYLWKVDNDDVTPNSEENIRNWRNEIAPELSSDNLVTYHILSGTTTDLQTQIDNLPPASSGALVEPTYTDNGNGTITLDSVQYALYDNDSFEGRPQIYTISAATTTTTAGDLQLIDETQNYIVVDYNSGNPIYKVIQNVELITESSILPHLTVYRNGDDLHVLSWDAMGVGLNNKLHQRLVKTDRFVREDGMIISETSTPTPRTVIVTSGRGWNGVHRGVYNGSNSSTEPMYQYIRDGVGGWTSSEVNVYNNTQYDNGTGTLATLDNKYYSVLWFFACKSDNLDHISYLWGEGQFKYYGDAIVSPVPINLPKPVKNTALLVGRIIIQKGEDSGYVTSAFDITFVAGAGAVNSSDVIYDNSGSGLNAFDVQNAIDELDGNFTEYSGVTAPNTYQNLKNNYTIIHSVDDFPTPIDDKINLEADWVYEIKGIVNIAPYQINMGSAATIHGTNPTRDVLVTYNENAIIKGENVGGILRNVGLNNLHPSGEIFNMIDDGTNLLAFYSIYVLDHAKIGLLSGFNFILFDSIFFVDHRESLDIIGGTGQTNPTTIFITKGYSLNQTVSGNTLFSINDGYFDVIKFSESDYEISNGNTFLYVNNDNVNLSGGTLNWGIITNNVFVLDVNNANVLSGITTKDGGWEMNSNTNLQDSNFLANVLFTFNTDITTITTQGVYTRLAGTNDESSFSERMDITQDDSRIDVVCPCNPKITLEIFLGGSIMASANNQNVLITIIKNQVTPIIIEQEVFCVRGNEPVVFSMSGFDNSVIGDYYEIYVANLSSTANIRIVDMFFKVLKI